MLVIALIAMSETPISTPLAAPSMHAVVLGAGAEARADEQQNADQQRAGLEGDQRRHRVAVVRRRAAA